MPKWRTEEAFSLYKMYHDASQERFNIRKEQEFNNLLLNYEQLRHEAEISMKDREIAVSRRRFVFMAFAVILLGMLLLWFRSLYAKKQEMYQSLCISMTSIRAVQAN